MEKIKTNIEVKVTYTVSLGEVEIPQDVYGELMEIYQQSETVDWNDERKATEWLLRNIEENDCLDWEAEINEINY